MTLRHEEKVLTMAEKTKIKGLAGIFGPKAKQGWGVAAKWVFVRLLIGLLGYLLAVVTAVVVIPQIAMHLHGSMMALLGPGATAEGLAAFWYAPVLFSILALVVVEYRFMSWLWSVGTRSIEKTKRKSLEELGMTEVPADQASSSRLVTKGKKQTATKGRK